MVAPDGLIVTVWHLVASATSLKVALPDGRNLTAQIKATDQAHDLVVIRIDASGLPAGQLANDAKLDIGQTLLALGGPEGAASASVSSGILSATNRTVGVRDPTTGRDDPVDGLIQTDASINFQQRRRAAGGRQRRRRRHRHHVRGRLPGDRLRRSDRRGARRDPPGPVARRSRQGTIDTARPNVRRRARLLPW